MPNNFWLKIMVAFSSQIFDIKQINNIVAHSKCRGVFPFCSVTVLCNHWSLRSNNVFIYANADGARGQSFNIIVNTDTNKNNKKEIRVILIKLIL